MGCYIALDDASTIEAAIADISQQLYGAQQLVAGDFNSDLAVPEGHIWYK